MYKILGKENKDFCGFPAKIMMSEKMATQAE